jgi:hypothetical protein
LAEGEQTTVDEFSVTIGVLCFIVKRRRLL